MDLLQDEDKFQEMSRVLSKENLGPEVMKFAERHALPLDSVMWLFYAACPFVEIQMVVISQIAGTQFLLSEYYDRAALT